MIYAPRFLHDHIANKKHNKEHINMKELNANDFAKETSGSLPVVVD